MLRGVAYVVTTLLAMVLVPIVEVALLLLTNKTYAERRGEFVDDVDVDRMDDPGVDVDA